MANVEAVATQFLKKAAAGLTWVLTLLVSSIVVDVLWHTHTAPAHTTHTLTVICIFSPTCRVNAAAQPLKNFA